MPTRSLKNRFMTVSLLFHGTVLSLGDLVLWSALKKDEKGL
jgi:hypothetical protein